MADPKSLFNTLLDLSGITKVYFIDDYLADEIDIDAVLVIAGEMIVKGEVEAVISNLKSIIDLSKIPQEEITSKLRSYCDELQDDNVKKKLVDTILSLSDEKYLKESTMTSKIVSLFPKAEGVPPTKWDNIKDNILENELKLGKVLILFDHDLSKAKGFEKRKGTDLIVELKQKDFFNQLNCILISHDILEAKDELPTRARLIKDGNGRLTEADFFPISKKRLEVENHFFDGIKKALINGYFESIKASTVTLIKKSYKKAINAIKSFDTYDFDETVLQTSIKEGIWAPETIIRISDIIFETELKRRMVKTDYVRKINGQIKQSEKFSGILFKVDDTMQPYSDKLRLRHNETYDPGNIINALRKPLENGDIFELKGIKYVLVAQPCDMMVRGSGQKMGFRNAKTATLLKVNVLSFKDYNDKKKKNDHYLRDKYALPYFTIGTNEVGIVEFTDFIIVDIDFLDLCVLNEAGHCIVNINAKGVDAKQFLSSTWVHRYDLLIGKLRPYVKKFVRIKRQLQSYHLRSLVDSSSKSIMSSRSSRRLKVGKKRTLDFSLIEKEIHPKIILTASTALENPVKISNDGTVDFYFKRVAKYKDFGASYLLERYTRHLARIAEPHDFALSRRS